MDAATSKINLDKMGVAAPCSAEWATMTGDERVRHCSLCKKNVYNLSEMSRAEAEALIREKEGRLCVRFYQRADGTVLTANCPVGLRAVQRRLRWIGAGVAAFLALCVTGVWARSSAGTGFNGALRSKPVVNKLQDIQPFKVVIDLLDPPVQSKMVMGTLCVRPTPVTPPPSPAPVATTQSPAK